MPELPEVETIRCDIASAIRFRTIVSIRKGSADYPSLKRAVGATIGDVRRRGKYLIVDLGPLELIIHLGMSGRLFAASALPVTKHIRAVLQLDDAHAIVFVDRRRFGLLKVVRAGDYSRLPTLARIGPEPLSPDFTLGMFSKTAASSTSTIKALLLNQHVVAGLGNIYVDEVLHRAGIHPAARRLSSAEASKLHASIAQVLTEAIARRGTTFSLYRDGLLREGDYASELRVFGRGGLSCRRCGTRIVKVRVAGRGTHYCPRCQPRRRKSGLTKR